MNPLIKIFSKVVRADWAEGPWGEENVFRYRHLWKAAVLINGTFCLLPLVIMTAVNYSQYQRALQHEMVDPIRYLTSNTKRAVEFFLEERRAALNFIVEEKTFEELSDRQELRNIFNNMKNAFGGFIDIGLIDSAGSQRSYAGPYALLGKNYADQAWFHEVNLRGAYVSDMFTGYRGFPHFVIAVKHEEDNGDFFVLRATIDMEMLHQQIRSASFRPSSDAFLINRQGIVQTPSRFHGGLMQMCSLGVPPLSEITEVVRESDSADNPYILAYSYIRDSPFIFMVGTEPSVLNQSWFALRRKLIVFLVASMIIILLLIMATSAYMVAHIQEADQRRARLFHEMEYTNKMASVGRLAAGVAHEINNPLAIINEKAGLLKDLISAADDFPQKERILNFSDGITTSVERCGTITHRLLSFAKHMDVKTERINLDHLIREVLGFLEKEADYRGLAVQVHAADTLPLIRSDKGQLQQVFLNIINNAFAAVDKGGRIEINLRETGPDCVSVTVSDNGCGIPGDHLEHIFEPFFTTKKAHGTGLGLSITYGILQKLGGRIDVKSQVGEGTSFTVTLPVNKSLSGK